MFASSSLLALSSLLLATTTTTTASAQSSPYSKFINDANSLLAAATGSDAADLDALYSWQATQTAVASGAVDSQYQQYLDAYMTATSAPLPAWVTAIPSSLQPVATSFLQAEASLVVQDIAPIVSQQNAASSAPHHAAPTVMSSSSSSSNTTVALTTSAPSATASSGFVIGSANRTASSWSGNGTALTLSANGTVTASVTSLTATAGSPTRSVTPPVTPQVTASNTNGAGKPAGVAVAAAAVGILGLVVLL